MHTGKYLGRSLEQRLAAPRELMLPSPHLGLTWRPLDVDDLDPVRELIDDSADPRISDEPRLSTLITPHVANDSQNSADFASLGGWDSAGTLQAFGLVVIKPHPLTELQADIFGLIRPQWRGRGIGRALLEWQDGRARQLMLAQGRDLPASIRSKVHADNMGRRRLLTAGGFSPQTSWAMMDLDLETKHKSMAESARTRLRQRGMELRRLDESDGDEVRRLHNRLAMVMERRQPLTEDEWEKRLSESDPYTSAILTDGEHLVGYSLCVVDHHLARMRVTSYGIDRGFRQQGNGTDLLLSQVGIALRREYRTVRVPVVSATASLAPVLTEYGFHEGQAEILYTIDI
ncbi:GNAT family N-acetyltransferase [Trueperella bialowiezensis]|uniref:Acetyltransferase (GNAT) family n=1 Tax=Trueperella bialowiezensis TaxID=312285 RepID=A0A448PC88_9ACTO|nr:GNAT family N-acetyltransferase [Trueperella bialowiezensis]VEI12516.1 Acetyltransferase (GNAT) family [Trueperella bialowiezensis]